MWGEAARGVVVGKHEERVLPNPFEDLPAWSGSVASSSRWSPSARRGIFPKPTGLVTQVEFWKKVFAEYSENQVVIHDNLYLDKIYTVIDLRPLAASGAGRRDAAPRAASPRAAGDGSRRRGARTRSRAAGFRRMISAVSSGHLEHLQRRHWRAEIHRGSRSRAHPAGLARALSPWARDLAALSAANGRNLPPRGTCRWS